MRQTCVMEISSSQWSAFMLLLQLLVGCHANRMELRGHDEFAPCLYEQLTHAVHCHTNASATFGPSLPSIHADGLPINKIIMEGNGLIHRCEANTFKYAASLEAKYVGGIKELIIKDTRLDRFEPDCFAQLNQLRHLHIINRPNPDSNQTTMSASTQKRSSFFDELKQLPQLTTLKLINVNLRSGIPENAFVNGSDHLETLELVANGLDYIHENAFPDQIQPFMLTELRIEKQEEGWKLLTNSDKWARNLKKLRSISFKGSIMQPPQAQPDWSIVAINFSDPVNKGIQELNLENTGLKKICKQKTAPLCERGISLEALSPYIEKLYIGNNTFKREDANDTNLQGLTVLRNLRVLNMNDNPTAFHSLPNWLRPSFTKLKELHISRSGLTYIQAGALPVGLQALHLSGNHLRSIDEHWFSDRMRNMTELHLNHIDLTKMDISGHGADWSRALRPLRKQLLVLSLIACQLHPHMLLPAPHQQWSSDVNLGVNHLEALHTLALANNQLTHIPTNVFSAMGNLKRVNLANNQMQTLGDPTLLEVEGSAYKSIDRHHLEGLDLSNNQLTTLDRCENALGFGRPFEDIIPTEAAWENGLQSTTVVGYEDNLGKTGANLTTWFGGLVITGNPFHCDCRMAWFRRVVQRMTMRLSKSKRRLRKEQRDQEQAPDFICAGNNSWTGRRFLSLEPRDLFVEMHKSCEERPQIYGTPLTLDNELIPCTRLPAHLVTPSGSQEYKKMMRMLIGRMNKLTLTTTEEDDDGAPQGNDYMGLSTGALIMSSIAGGTSLCFLIACFVILIWLCLYMKRRRRRRISGRTTTVTKVYSRINELSLGGCVSDGGSVTITCTPPVICQCCAARRSQHRPTSDAQSSLVRLRRDGETVGSRSVYEDPTESFYSRTSAVEGVSIGGGMLAASNDDNENTALRASDGLYKSSRLKLPMLTNRRIHRGDEARKPDGTQLTRDKRYHINHLQKYRQAKRGSAFGITARELAQSTGALTSHSNNQFQPLPPDAPLPPVPSPRKSKSYTDLHSRCTNNAQVASTNTNVWDTTRVSWKSLENATSSMPSANGTQRNCSIDDIYCHQVRDGTWQKMSLWQSKSLDSNRRKFGRRGITLNSAKNEHQSSEQPGWLRSSGRKLIQGLNRLRNTVRGKGQSETIDSPSTALPSLDCRRRIISPELPTPQLLIANQHTQKDERRPSPINNYLPMSPNTDDDLYSDAQGQKETTLDEKGRLDWPPKSRESIYTEHTPMKTDTKSNTSRSTNWAVQNPNQTSIAINPSRPTKNVISNGSTADQSLYLSENLYQWSFLDDDGDSARKESEEAKYLPLAPPPPSMNTSPAPSRGQNNGYNRQGVAQNTLAPAPLILPRAPLPPPAAPPLARPAPPLAPKPRHVIPGHVMKLVHGTPPPQNKPVGR